MDAMVKVAELKKQAATIEAAVAEAETAVFVVGSGDINYKAVPHEDILSVDQQFAYSTQACGDAYRTELILHARRCGKDERGREIIRTSSGKVLYWTYYRGSPSSFDSGKFEAE